MLRWVRAVVVLSICLACPASFAEPVKVPEGLAPILAAFAQSSGMSASFVEEKRILLMKEPLRNEGRVFFRRPGSLARIVDRPFPSKVQLAESRLSLTEGETTRVIDLDSQPAVRALVGGFLSLLEADVDGITRDYHVALETLPDGSWKVLLTPRGAPIDRLLKELSFTGKGGVLDSMRWVERSGDVSLTRFSDVKLNRTFSDREVVEYFSSTK
jgi:hypothetical protein